MKIIFINLTNGIEAIEKFNFNLNEIQFIRLQSCRIEAKMFEEILLEIDDNFLMFLAMGFECEVYDFGALNETSKAVYYGLEWIRFALNKRWLKRTEIPIVKGKNVLTDFEKKYSSLSWKCKKRLDYFFKFLNTNEIKITSVTSATVNDNKPEYYSEIIKTALKQLPN